MCVWIDSSCEWSVIRPSWNTEADHMLRRVPNTPSLMNLNISMHISILALLILASQLILASLLMQKKCAHPSGRFVYSQSHNLAWRDFKVSELQEGNGPRWNSWKGSENLCWPFRPTFSHYFQFFWPCPLSPHALRDSPLSVCPSRPLQLNRTFTIQWPWPSSALRDSSKTSSVPLSLAL